MPPSPNPDDFGFAHKTSGVPAQIAATSKRLQTQKRAIEAKKTSRLSVENLPIHQRPRERLLEVGPTNATTLELLAVIIGHGNTSKDVLSLARIAEQWLAQKTSTDLLGQQSDVPGLSRALTLKLIAIQELCRRSQESTITPTLSSPENIVAQVASLGALSQERVVVLYVDARLKLLRKQTVAIGKHNSVQLEPRDVLREALLLPSYGVVIVHNHPSGNPQPSSDDLVFTQKMQSACQLMGVALIDHLIVTKNSWHSFRSAGYFSEY